MKLELNASASQRQPGADSGRSRGTGFFEFNKQVLRVLHCSALALASSPGGLRFKAGTRPWLEGLQPSVRTLHSQAAGLRLQATVLGHVDAS